MHRIVTHTSVMALVRHLLWDEWNVSHIARHEVSPEEVEEACHGAPLTLEAKKGRIILIGPTVLDRMLAVVLSPKARGLYYPVTARSASVKERRLYEENKNNS